MPGGRKSGAGWLTHLMWSRAQEEAVRLSGAFPRVVDQGLVLVLLRSAAGDVRAKAKARAALAAAMRLEAEEDHERAKDIVRELRARFGGTRPAAAQF